MDLIDLVSDSGDSLSSCSSVLEVPGVNEETYVLSYDPGTLNLGYCVFRDAGEQEVVDIGVINPDILGMTADHVSAALHVICDMHRDRYPGIRLVLIEHQLTFQGARPYNQAPLRNALVQACLSSYWRAVGVEVRQIFPMDVSRVLRLPRGRTPRQRAVIVAAEAEFNALQHFGVPISAAARARWLDLPLNLRVHAADALSFILFHLRLQ